MKKFFYFFIILNTILLSNMSLIAEVPQNSSTVIAKEENVPKSETVDSGFKGKKSNPIFSKEPFRTIIDRGVLIVATHKDDHSPFHMVNSKNELIGIDIDIAKKIASYLGVDLKIDREATNYDDVVNAVKEGRADLGISKLSFTPERSQNVLFLDKPYIVLHKAIMLNRRALSSVEDNQSIIDVLSNPKIRVGVLANTSYVGFAKKLLPKATLIEFESWDKFKMSLKEGKIDAAFRDDCELSKLLKQFPDFNFNFSIYSLKEEVDPIFIVLGLECELFGKWLQELMDADKTMSYELKTVMEKYKNNL